MLLGVVARKMFPCPSQKSPMSLSEDFMILWYLDHQISFLCKCTLPAKGFWILSQNYIFVYKANFRHLNLHFQIKFFKII